MDNDFPATPEEKQAMVDALAEDWNPAENIIELFDRIKELLEKQASMLGRPTYTAEDFIQNVYMAVKEPNRWTRIVYDGIRNH